MFVFGVLLNLFGLLLLGFQEEAHLQLSQRKLALGVLLILLGIHRFLKVNEFASLMSPQIDVAVAQLFLRLHRHDFDFDVIIALRILELAKILEVRVALF